MCKQTSTCTNIYEYTTKNEHGVANEAATKKYASHTHSGMNGLNYKNILNTLAFS